MGNEGTPARGTATYWGFHSEEERSSRLPMLMVLSFGYISKQVPYHGTRAVTEEHGVHRQILSGHVGSGIWDSVVHAFEPHCRGWYYSAHLSDVHRIIRHIPMCPIHCLPLAATQQGREVCSVPVHRKESSYSLFLLSELLNVAHVSVSIWLRWKVCAPSSRQGFIIDNSISCLLLSSDYENRNKLLGFLMPAWHPSSCWHVLMHKSYYEKHLLSGLAMWAHSKMSSGLTHHRAEEKMQLRLAVASVWRPHLSSTFHLRQPENLNCLGDTSLRLKVMDRKFLRTFSQPSGWRITKQLQTGSWKDQSPYPKLQLSWRPWNLTS